MPVSSVAIYGGNDGIRFEQEKKGLTLGADVVIATPGTPDQSPELRLCRPVESFVLHTRRSRPYARYGICR